MLVEKKLSNRTTIILVAVDEIFADIEPAENAQMTASESHIFFDAVVFNGHELWPKYPPRARTLAN
ncbi:MAG: hypothetical protein Q8L10_02240 [Candidatus Moranbacteria bacterium]|nr:hypothetical protein [Candidatus Moranbacteria bacterium]